MQFISAKHRCPNPGTVKQHHKNTWWYKFITSTHPLVDFFPARHRIPSGGLERALLPALPSLLPPTRILAMRLELGLVLSLLQDGLHLHSLHHVAADLELASHEEALGVLLAGDEGTEVRLGKLEGDFWYCR